MMTEIQDMVQFVTQSLADKPEDVRITESVGEGVIMIEINVAAEDMGRLIGRQGRTINAIRSLARVLAAKMEKKVSVEIV
jgi:uncharacterized protein